ncbi:MAG: VIT domain-containing protein [Acidobacteriota bacterium]
MSHESVMEAAAPGAPGALQLAFSVSHEDQGAAAGMAAVTNPSLALTSQTGDGAPPDDEVVVVAVERRNGERSTSFGGAMAIDPDGSGRPAEASGLLVEGPSGNRLRVAPRSTRVHAAIAGFLARTDVEQTFAIASPEPAELVYELALPPDAAVRDFVFEAGGRRIAGIVRPRAEATAAYERYRSEGKLVSLVEQERPDLFSIRIAAIPPDAMARVKLTLFHPLAQRGGRPSYRLPLPAERGRLEASFAIRAGIPIASLSSATHPLLVTRVSPREMNATIARDVAERQALEIAYGLDASEMQIGVLAHRAAPEARARTGDERGYFTATVVPPALPAAASLAPREITLVVDTSGSMVDRPLELSKEIVGRTLAALGPSDRFNVIRFSDGAAPMWPSPRAANSANVAEALAFVTSLGAAGSSAMHEAVSRYLATPHDPALVRVVCFLSDGMVGYDMRIMDAVREHGSDSRWFTFGVGSYVNRKLLEGLAREGRGAMFLVPIDGSVDVAERVSAFVSMVGAPVLTDVWLDGGGAGIEDVMPRRVADLRPGHPVTISGRYAHGGRTVLKLRGRSGARDVEVPVIVDLPQVEESNDAIAVLWARQRIDELVVQLATDPSPELADAIRDLALAHRLVSPFTSLIAVDDTPAASGRARSLFTTPPPDAGASNGRWLAAWNVVLVQEGDRVVVGAVTRAAGAIQAGDQIVAVDGREVKTLREIEAALRRAPPGPLPIQVREHGSKDVPATRIWLERP